MHANCHMESPEKLTEDLISLVRAYLKIAAQNEVLSRAQDSGAQNQEGQPGAPEAVPSNPPG